MAIIRKSIYVLVHIPKCGGRSVFKIFKDIFGEERVLNLYVNLFQPEGNEELIEAFNEQRLDLSKYKAVCGGHIDYDSHHGCFQDRERLYVALVREPLERFISYFNYLSMSDEESKHLPGRFPSSHPTLVEMAKSCKDVEQFYHRVLEDGDPSWYTSNIQAMFLRGRRDCSVDNLIESLKGYHLVMPLPLIGHFSARLAAENGISGLRPPRENFSIPRATAADVSPEFRELYRKRADLDYFVYYYVYANALQSIAQDLEEQRDEFESEVSRLREGRSLLSRFLRTG